MAGNISEISTLSRYWSHFKVVLKMEILKYYEIDLSETIKRSEEDVNKVLDIVSDILNNVKEIKTKLLENILKSLTVLQ